MRGTETIKEAMNECGPSELKGELPEQDLQLPVQMTLTEHSSTGLTACHNVGVITEDGAQDVSARADTSNTMEAARRLPCRCPGS